MGQHRHEYGRNAGEPGPRQRESQGKISLSVTAQWFDRWQILLLRLLLAAKSHENRQRIKIQILEF